jgi:Negative regulator of beta-lactamase expression
VEIIWNPTPNYSSGRNGRVPLAIVDHITSGNFPGCLSWLCNTAAQSSAHYLVNQAGDIYQLVKDEDTAWHAGIVNHPNWSLYDGTNPNRYTIGIEHEGFDGTLTELQYQATLWLHKQIMARWGISADTDHIIGHYRIDSVNRPNCPGPNFPWQRLFNDLNVQSVSIAVGNQIVQGIIVGDRSYAPIRAIAQILGFQYGYNAEIPAVIINGATVPIVIQNDTGYAKVNDLATAIGHQVQWDAQNNIVKII